MKTLIDCINDVITEAKGNKRRHGSTSFKDLINIAEELGCTTIERNNKIIVQPPKDRMVKLNVPLSLHQYITHPAEEGYHPLRKYLKNVCKFEDPRLNT